MARATLTPPRSVVALLLGVIALGACRTQAPPPAQPAQPHVSQMVQRGDAARRASMRLVVSGLDADEAGRAAEASSLYGRALQVDPTNPWAWLALARQEVFEGDPERGLDHLDKAAALLASDDAAQAHLAGIRAAGLRAVGQAALAEPFLAEARELAPAAWADAQLDAAELR